MRLDDYLFEGRIKDMAREFVSFENYIYRVMDAKAKNPDKAKGRLRDAFRELDKQIRKALKEK